MFVQVMRGKISDEALLWAALDRWEADLRPDAPGFLGSTTGITPAGEVVGIARFESEELARRNSDRPEQGAWWAEFEKAFDGPVTFLESTDVDVQLGGGSNDAGFVQVMFGRGDREAARAALGQADILREERPDLVGGYTAWLPDGRFVDVAYFRSEREAREGESKERSERLSALFEQFTRVMPIDEYLDLPDPKLV